MKTIESHESLFKSSSMLCSARAPSRTIGSHVLLYHEEHRNQTLIDMNRLSQRGEHSVLYDAWPCDSPEFLAHTPCCATGAIA